MILPMLQPYSRYRMRRSVKSLSEGEELTFVTRYRVFDRDTGYDFDELVFVEKNLCLYLVEEDGEEADILSRPDLYFEKIGEVDKAHADQELAARRDRFKAQALEEERHKMLEKAQKRLDKHREKHPKS
jgi:hypothetical protein